MICEFCRNQNLKSKIFSEGFRGLLGGSYSFYDEDGIFHIHNMNYVSETLRCSNGHMWTETKRPECPSCNNSWYEDSILNH